MLLLQEQKVPANVQARGSKFQLRATHALLPKAFFFTFETKAEATAYGEQLMLLLANGVVPQEMLTVKTAAHDPLVIEMLRAYNKGAPITDSDEALLGVMMGELVTLRLSSLTYQWVDGYVRQLKTVRNLTPSTIRKRIGVLGRVFDWYIKQADRKDDGPAANVFRMLPRGYSLYGKTETAALRASGRQAKQDQVRDRRLSPEEELDLRAALSGVKRPDRERALQVDPSFVLLFDLILDTGLRLREAYRLRINQIDFARRFINVEGTKGHRGKLKPRQVPIKPHLLALLKPACAGRVGLVFPFWDGSEAAKDLARVTSRLSVRFGSLFSYAGVDGFTEHDLRHEATCRWLEMRDARGAWIFNDMEICRIMGWTRTDMMLRYASLRGEDLSARMAAAYAASTTEAMAAAVV